MAEPLTGDKWNIGPLMNLEPPTVDIGLDQALRKGIATQLRALADLLEPITKEYP